MESTVSERANTGSVALSRNWLVCIPAEGSRPSIYRNIWGSEMLMQQCRNLLMSRSIHWEVICRVKYVGTLTIDSAI